MGPHTAGTGERSRGARRARAACGSRRNPLGMKQVRALERDAGGEGRRELRRNAERGGTHPGDVRPADRRVVGAGTVGELTGAARMAGCEGRVGAGARGAAALERLGHGAQAVARALMDAGAEDGERERARGAEGQAGRAARARTGAAMARRERLGVAARVRDTRARRRARGQRGRGHDVRTQAGFDGVGARVAAVMYRGIVRDVARRVGRCRRWVYGGWPRSPGRVGSGRRARDRLVASDGRRARGGRKTQRTGEHDRGQYDPCGATHVRSIDGPGP
jgi:hypothetical protein